MTSNGRRSNADALQDLRAQCERLLKKSDDWEPGDLDKEFILDLLHHLVDTTPRKGVTAELTANLCDLFGPTPAGGMKATYRVIAELTGKTEAAVRKAYERKFGLTRY